MRQATSSAGQTTEAESNRSTRRGTLGGVAQKGHRQVPWMDMPTEGPETHLLSACFAGEEWLVREGTHPHSTEGEQGHTAEV